MNAPTIVIHPDHEVMVCDTCGVHPTHGIWLMPDGGHLCGMCLRAVRPDLTVGPADA